VKQTDDSEKKDEKKDKKKDKKKVNLQSGGHKGLCRHTLCPRVGSVSVVKHTVCLRAARHSPVDEHLGILKYTSNKSSVCPAQETYMHTKETYMEY